MSAIHFENQACEDDRGPKCDTSLDWAVNELVETIKTHGARKTDVLLTDSNAAWLGLINMTKKEAARIAEQIPTAYRSALDRNDLAGTTEISAVLCSYPEDVKSEKDFYKSRLEMRIPMPPETPGPSFGR